VARIPRREERDDGARATQPSPRKTLVHAKAARRRSFASASMISLLGLFNEILPDFARFTPAARGLTC